MGAVVLHSSSLNIERFESTEDRSDAGPVLLRYSLFPKYSVATSYMLTADFEQNEVAGDLFLIFKYNLFITISSQTFRSNITNIQDILFQVTVTSIVYLVLFSNVF